MKRIYEVWYDSGDKLWFNRYSKWCMARFTKENDALKFRNAAEKCSTGKHNGFPNETIKVIGVPVYETLTKTVKKKFGIQ